MYYFLRWIRNLFVRTITQVNVILYENGKERDVSVYDAQRLSALIESINTLWKVPDKSSYCFETEVSEQRSCFKPPVVKIHVICYREDVFTNGFKTKTGIPMRYRKKMFDRSHNIYPQAFGNQLWSKEMTVRFRIQD